MARLAQASCLLALLAIASAVAGATAGSAPLRRLLADSSVEAGRQLLDVPTVPAAYAFLSGHNFTCTDPAKEFHYVVRLFNKAVRDPLGVTGAVNAGYFSAFNSDVDPFGTAAVVFSGGDKKDCPVGPGGKKVARETTVYLHCSSDRKTFCGVASDASPCSYAVHWYSPELCLSGATSTPLPPSPPAVGVDPAYQFLAGRRVTCPALYNQWDYRVQFFAKAEQLHRGTDNIGANIGRFSNGNGANLLSFPKGDTFNCGNKARSTAVTLNCASTEFTICGEVADVGCTYTFDYYSPELCVNGATPLAPKTYTAHSNRDYPGNNLGDEPKCGISVADCQSLCNNIAGCAMVIYGTHAPWYNSCCWPKSAVPATYNYVSGLTAYKVNVLG